MFERTTGEDPAIPKLNPELAVMIASFQRARFQWVNDLMDKV
jgi:hypothetical protein